MQRKIITLMVFFLLVINCAKAQKIDTLTELKNLYIELKDTKHMGYNYESDISFPNGNKDRISGRMLINFEEKFLFNDCEAYTMLYTNHLFYKANHREKTIMFINTEKNYDKHLRKKTEQDIFEGGAMGNFADTSMLRIAKVKGFKISSVGILSVTLSFPTGSKIKRLDLQYDKINKLPISYIVEMYEPFASTIDGVSIKLKCTKFTNNKVPTTLLQNEYYSYKMGKLDLKKFTSYKISTNSIKK